MARFNTFGEVVDLDRDALTALVRGEGDAPERLWAAWALALRDPSATAMLGDAVASEPSEGVRAQLAIVLLGHGERDAVVVMARKDPSALVRASAFRGLARLAARGDDATEDLLAAALTHDLEAIVRGAILDGLHPPLSPLLRARVVARLADSHVDVRLQAIDLVTRDGSSGAFDLVLERAREEPDARVFRTAVLASAALRDVSAVFASTVTWPSANARRLLDVLAQASFGLSEATLAPLLERADASLDERLIALDDTGRVALGVVWLLRIAVRSGVRGKRLRGALEALTTIDDETRALVTTLYASIERAWDDECRALDEEDSVAALARIDEDIEPWVDGVELLPVLQRLR